MRRNLTWKSITAFARARLLALRASEAGFTMIEIMVTAVLVALIAAATAQSLIATSDFSGDQRHRSQADEIAQQDQERLKGMSDEALAALSQSRSIALDGTNFTVTSSATFLDTSGQSSCTSKLAAYFRLVSTVSWPGAGSAPHSVTESAITTRPAAGSLLVQVQDETKSPLPGVTVTATGQTTGGTQSSITDMFGCVVFSGLPGLPVQSYSVVAQHTGYVDPDGNDYTPNVTAAVNGNGIATPSTNPLSLGLAGSLTATFTTNANNGVAVTVPGYGLAYYGNRGGNHMSVFKNVVPPSLPATPMTASRLFPFSMPGAPDYTNNYTIWAGRCQAEQPAVPPANTNSTTVRPGGAASAVAFEPALDAAVSYRGGPVPPTDVKITFNSTSGTSCSDQWFPVFSARTDVVGTTSYGVYPAPFASSAASGNANASSTGDTGVDVFCADYLTGGRYYKETATTTNSNVNGPSGFLVMDLGTDTARTVNGVTYSGVTSGSSNKC
jgi:prepilin-type N-terminal cleavage/methylation domain-containing protein